MGSLYVEPLFFSEKPVENKLPAPAIIAKEEKEISFDPLRDFHLFMDSLPEEKKKLLPTLTRLKAALEDSQNERALELLDLLEDLLDLHIGVY
jgi:hypothetical protein